MAEEYLRHEERRGQKKFLEALSLKQEGLTTAEIARRLGVSRPTLIAWFQHEHYQDRRGWVKGELRKYRQVVRDRVIALKRRRIEQEKYFLGAPYVQMDYAKRYPAYSGHTCHSFRPDGCHGFRCNAAARSERSDAVVGLGVIHLRLEFVFSHGIALQRKAVGMVHQPIENGIGQCGIIDETVPVLDRILTGDDCRAAPIAVFEDLEQIATLFLADRSESEVVQDDQIRARQTRQELAVTAVPARHGQIIHESWQAQIAHA